MDTGSTQQLKTPADAGKGPAGEVKRWLIELDYCEKSEKDWRARGAAVVRRYRNERQAAADPTTPAVDTFNVLWSNVETMRPAIYNSTPEPVVTDRFGDDDPLVKCAIDILRRAIKYTLSSQDFDQVMNLAVQDYLLPGRGGVRVRYVPTLQPQRPEAQVLPMPGAPPGMPGAPPMAMSMTGMPPAPPASTEPQAPGEGEEAGAEDIAFEEIRFELVDWDGFRRGYAKTWADLPWIAFEHQMRYEDLAELLGKAMADRVPLSTRVTGGGDKADDDDEEGVFKTACVYEIWDKRSRSIIYVCPDYKQSVLKRVADEYELGGFWPMPRMLYALETSESLVPAPEFSQYETLADQLEVLTKRMAGLARACVLRGFYAQELGEIKSLMEADDSILLPTANGDRYTELGGLDKAIMFFPLEMLIKAYQALSIERENVKTAIYELMGASDIMRGVTQAMETAAAQRIKSRWGSVRLRRRQSEIERFCRDLLALAAEVIAERFSMATLKAMTGANYPMQAERDAARGQVQQLTQMKQQIESNPQMKQQVPPQVLQQGEQMLAKAQDLAGKPCWEEIMAFLRNDAMRRFKIDVQTDSTIALQQHEDQMEFGSMVQALADFTEKIMPLVAQGALPFEAAKEMLLATCRKFRLGYEVSEAIGAMKQPPPPDPKNSPEGLKVQAELASAEKIAAGKAQADLAKVDKEQAAKQAQIAADAKLNEQAKSNELALQQSNDQRQQLLDGQQHERTMEELRIKAAGEQADRNAKLAEARIRALAQIETARIAQGLDSGDAIVAALEAVSFPGGEGMRMLTDTQRESQQMTAAQIATMQQLGDAVGKLHAATTAPRRRTLLRGPDGRATGAVDSIDPAPPEVAP